MHIIHIFFQAVFFFIILTVVLSYIIRTYELGSRKEKAVEDYEKRELRDGALGILGEIMAVFISIILYPLGRIWGENSFSSLAPGQRPVIFCHGYMHNRSAFFFMMYRLKKAGLRNLFAPNFSPLSGSVSSFAGRLSEIVSLAVSQTGSERVDLVGHSMGGLVVRYYIENLGGASFVNKAVTLGSPHLGTKMAVLSPFESAKQFRIDSPLITGFETAQPPRDSVELVSIWSDFDNVVIPPENAKLPEPNENIMVREAGHLALLFSPQVIGHVQRLLAEKPGA